MEANSGEAHTALLAAQLASDHGCSFFIIVGDSLMTTLAINSPHLLTDWAPAPIYADIRQQLLFFPKWTALKTSRCANFYAHHIENGPLRTKCLEAFPLTPQFFPLYIVEVEKTRCNPFFLL